MNDALTDGQFDAQFGALGIAGRDPEHWELLRLAVLADREAAPKSQGGLEIEPGADVIERVLLGRTDPPVGFPRLGRTDPPVGFPRPGRTDPPVSFPRPGRTVPPVGFPRFALARRVVFATAAACAVGLALWSLTPPTQGDPRSLVPRGAPPSAPQLIVDVAARTASGTARLDPTRAYAAGDTLIFRVSVAQSTTLTLTRRAASGETVLYTGVLPAGTHTLPVGYAFDRGDPDAQFVLKGGGEPVVVAVQGVP